MCGTSVTDLYLVAKFTNDVVFELAARKEKYSLRHGEFDEYYIALISAQLRHLL